MNLEFLDSVYKSIFNEDSIFWLVNISKAIGAIIILVTTLKALIENFTTTGKVFSENKDKSGFTPYLLFRSLILLFLIGLSPEILSFFDSVCASIEGEVLKGIVHQQQQIAIKETIENLPSENDNWITLMLKYLREIKDLFNPMTYIYGPANGIALSIAWAIDMFVYPLFLAKRYFFMGIIKIFLPLMFALSIFDKTRDYVYNILKVYARYFLAIIPLAFVTLFIDQIDANLLASLENNIDSVFTGNLIRINSGGIKLFVSIFSIFLKIRLYKESFTIMEKLIP
jgi:hypothetical protein